VLRGRFLGGGERGHQHTVSEIPTSYTGECTGNTGKVTLSPGLTGTPAVQTIKIKGNLTGCAGEPFTRVKYAATLKTAGPVSCSVLKTAGETATAAATYKWTPNTKSSTGTLSMPLTQTPGIAFLGEVTRGTFDFNSALTFSGTVSESYTGAAACGETVGGRAAKAVKKGTVSGSAVNVE
jgi:hypothetical protein